MITGFKVYRIKLKLLRLTENYIEVNNRISIDKPRVVITLLNHRNDLSW